MVGIDTFAIDRSRMFMNEPMLSAKVANASLPPVIGPDVAGVAGDGAGAAPVDSATAWLKSRRPGHGWQR